MSLSEVELGLAVDKVIEFVMQIDKFISTHKCDSEVSRIRGVKLEFIDASIHLMEYWSLCERELNLCAFDSWKVDLTLLV